MATYFMVCISGAAVVVAASSAEAAAEAWDKAAEAGDAEPRISGTTRRATPADVRACVDSGHDYR